jgi:cytochrome c peroxidase
MPKNRGLLRVSIAVRITLVVACWPALAQSQTQSLSLPAWFPPVWLQSRSAPVSSFQPGQTPAVIDKYLEHVDPFGRIASFQPKGATQTASNAFFAQLGTNGRTCFSCHQPQSAWSLDPASARAIFNASQGTDPLFAPVDGANCPDTGAAAQTLAEKAAAYSQLLQKGNIRVFLPIPRNAEFKVRVVKDPYGCETSPKYGLPAGMLSMYRRIIGATNLTRNAEIDLATAAIRPQGTIMWDGREPSLESQFIDATLGHAQATTPPTAAQVTQGVAFETGLFTAQSYSNAAGSLSAWGAMGGPINLSITGKDFVPTPVIPLAFHMFNAWILPILTPAQQSINRGQLIFNTRLFTINGVSGFNDAGGLSTASCSTCHNTLNVGSDVLPGGRHLGIGDNSSADKSGNQPTTTVLPPTSDQPLFSFLCPPGSMRFFSNPVNVNGVNYDEFQTTDPGMGLITGKCNDLGKFKVPRLNGLAARAPYFHNGSAASLTEVVEFYNRRFSIALSAQQKQDLVNFLSSL